MHQVFSTLPCERVCGGGKGGGGSESWRVQRRLAIAVKDAARVRWAGLLRAQTIFQLPPRKGTKNAVKYAAN